mgnify:CR=1 FL=1
MKKRMTCIALSLLMLCTLFSGCSQQTAAGPGAMGSEIWEVVPLTYGAWETEPLAVLPWNSGRLEGTSRNRFVETEKGYYLASSYLFYTDKDNLGQWYPVCNKPDCPHQTNSDHRDCNARLQTQSIIYRENRLYYSIYSLEYTYPDASDGQGYIIMSVASDGTDKQFVYKPEEIFFFGAGTFTAVLTDNNWVYYTEHLDKDGNKVYELFQVTEDGIKCFPGRTDLGNRDSYFTVLFHGEESYYADSLGTAKYGCYRIINGELVETDVSGLETDGAYISGNTLRIFKPGDGYYDVDLTTREEVRLADAQLKGSMADILLPNCVLETTLLKRETAPGQDGHQMRLFDGQKWRAVELPEDVVNLKNNCWNMLSWVCSDGVIIRLLLNGQGSHYYKIHLSDAETLQMTYMGKTY